MDPDKALATLRAMVRDVRAYREDGDVLADLAEGFAEQFQALDEWLTGGGFLPEAWAPRMDLHDEGTNRLLADVLDLAGREVDARLPDAELARRLEQVKAIAENTSPSSLGDDQDREQGSRPAQ